MKDHSVDLLLLDIVIDKGINVDETYEKIMKIHPGQKAIIINWFSETDEVKETLRLVAGRFMKKPLKLEEPGQALKEELGK